MWLLLPPHLCPSLLPTKLYSLTWPLLSYLLSEGFSEFQHLPNIRCNIWSSFRSIIFVPVKNYLIPPHSYDGPRPLYLLASQPLHCNCHYRCHFTFNGVIFLLSITVTYRSQVSCFLHITNLKHLGACHRIGTHWITICEWLSQHKCWRVTRRRNLWVSTDHLFVNSACH